MYTILVAICIVLLFIIMFLLQCATFESRQITGFWVASEQFKKQADLDQLLVYIGEGSGHSYKGYIIVSADGETIYNDTMNFRITPKGYFKGDMYEFHMERDIKCMPQRLTMILNNDGSMVLKCLTDKKVYAHTYKDNQMSANAVIEED